MLSASEPCGEAVNEDDVESGSPFLCALNKYQSLTRPDRAVRDIMEDYETTSDCTFGIDACRIFGK